MVPSSIININFAGRSFRLDTLDSADLIAKKIQDGSYEAPVPMLLSAAIARSTGLFVDVGANDGVYSLLAATARTDVRIVAFEPFPPVLKLLHRNIELNGFQGRIEILEVALSDSSGFSQMFLPDQGHGLVETSASLQEDFIAGAQPSISVPTQRLDDIDLKGVIGVAKVDIEGFELEFLRGSEKTIARDRPIIFAEMMSAAARKFPEISRRVADLDYLAFRLRPDAAILSHWIIFDEQAWNYSLIPKEKMPIFREICAVHGIEIFAPV